MQRVRTTCFHFYQVFLIILIPACVEPHVLMGQERAEHDCQAMQALQCACAVFISFIQTILHSFCGFSEHDPCYEAM